MIGFLRDNSTYIAVLAGFLLGLPFVRVSRKKGIKIPLMTDILKCLGFSVTSVISVLFFASMEGLLGGKGFHIEAVSTYGVYLIAPLLLLLLFRKDRSFVFDDFAVYVPVSLFLQRIRCIFSGCCYGKIIGSTGYRWPVREAEIVFYLFMLAFFVSQRRKGYKPSNSKYIGFKGSMFPFLMACYGCLRFLLEFFREGSTSVFHIAHVWSVLAVIAGLSIYIEIKRQNMPEKKKQRN